MDPKKYRAHIFIFCERYILSGGDGPLLWSSVYKWREWRVSSALKLLLLLFMEEWRVKFYKLPLSPFSATRLPPRLSLSLFSYVSDEMRRRRRAQFIHQQARRKSMEIAILCHFPFVKPSWMVVEIDSFSFRKVINLFISTAQSTQLFQLH